MFVIAITKTMNIYDVSPQIVVFTRAIFAYRPQHAVCETLAFVDVVDDRNGCT
jgi:hypothetical protein